MQRVHILAHANPIGRDVARFGFSGMGEFVAFIQAHLGDSFRLTHDMAVLQAVEEPLRGGRNDDARRVRELQGAIDDASTRVIVALAGGGYFARILPHIDLARIRARRAPLFVLGFSEMTGLINGISRYPMGRGIYWLCPNYLAWKLRPPERAQAAFGAFWRGLRRLVDEERIEWPAEFGEAPAQAARGVIACDVASGKPRPGRARIAGGCLSLLAACAAGTVGAFMRPRGHWLAIEDVNELPYRVDRYLATLKMAGWFERVAGVLVGNFRTLDAPNQSDATVRILPYHLPAAKKVPILVTQQFGHVWPMTPLWINRPMRLVLCGAKAEFHPSGPRRDA